MDRPNLLSRPTYAFKLRGMACKGGLDILVSFYCGSRSEGDHNPKSTCLVARQRSVARKNANSLSHEALLNSSSVQAVLEQARGSLDACLVACWCRF